MVLINAFSSFLPQGSLEWKCVTVVSNVTGNALVSRGLT